MKCLVEHPEAAQTLAFYTVLTGQNQFNIMVAEMHHTSQVHHLLYIYERFELDEK